MRGFIGALAAVGAFLALTAPADAHAMLDRATPAVGAVVHVAPSEIRLEFSEGVEASLSRVTLTGAEGARVQTGPAATPTRARRLLIVPLKASLAPGVYRVTWRVVSVDSHVTQGDFSFIVQP